MVAEIGCQIDRPLIAAGGIGTSDDVATACAAGASAVMVGTVLLRANESGASAIHRAALADPERTQTVITRAFTGRPARGLRNAFIDNYESQAPLGYPAIHHLTGPLRKAAAAAGQPELVHLWAGTGFRHASDAPTSHILQNLASRV
jgi:NAD(P)H-dependent flavin oxidoreductase YrpB (nitropropane dioxygenase family)